MDLAALAGFNLARRQPSDWLHTCLINDRPELLRLVFGILDLLLEELFLRGIQRAQLDRQLMVNRNGTW
jgi:hypothetical protein